MSRRQLTVVFATASLWGTLFGSPAIAENWGQWRGPNGTGITSSQNTVKKWDRETNVAWRYELDEPGNSSPVVWGNRVFLTQPYREKKLRALICLDRATGKPVWQQTVAYDQDESTHGTNFYCSASPVTDGQRVIAWFGSGGLVCYDFDGNQLWFRDLGEQKHMWGYGSSPILHKNLCILNFGPGERETLLAVDKRSGKTIWSVDAIDDEQELAISSRENDGNASPRKADETRADELRGSWGTPILVPDSGLVSLIVNHPRRLVAYDPGTGQTVWTCGGSGPLAYSSPMYADETVVALGGYFGGSFAVRTGGNGLVTESSRIWHKPRDGSWLGTGIILDKHLYIGDMQAIVHCIDVTSGEVIWKERLKTSSGRGGTWSSITMTDDGIAYLLSKSGDTFVFSPSPDGYQEIARNSLDESSNSTVVIADGDLFIRTHEALWCIRAASPES